MAKIERIASPGREKNSKCPRIWFCSHPEDLGLYLDRISSDILSRHECIIFYDEEPTADYDKELLLSDLEKMNLFVMPVTRRLLCEPSRALHVEFPFAMEHHIPVLPLMMEEGLDEEFNKLCGGLQCLYPTRDEQNARSYGEKLDTFLSEFLFGGELARKIAAEFDTYIFLSYRKVDRDYANELMHLIHKDELFRDVAIWYDEFLVPGESFDNNIKKAIYKSEVFALAITPHILDKNAKGEKNYIITHEYPEAVRKSKKILPLKMTPISQKRLKSTFKPEPPSSVNAHNEGMLRAALQTALKRIPLAKRVGNPEHDFLIGLSYLYGIDVEIDRERAITLIESSAKGGHAEAIEKLIFMHRNAEGVELDYEKAVDWQRRLVDKYRTDYKKHRGFALAYSYIYSSFKLGTMLTELGKTDEVLAVYEAALCTAKELYEVFPSFIAKSILADCYTRISSHLISQGEPSAALEKANLALRLLEENSKEEVREFGEEDDFTLSGLVHVLTLLQRLYREMGEYGRSEEYRKRAALMQDRMIQLMDDGEDAERVAEFYLNLATNSPRHKRIEPLQRALQLYREIERRQPNAQNKRSVAEVLLALANEKFHESSLGKSKFMPSIISSHREEIVKSTYGEDYVMPTVLELLKEAFEYYKEAVLISEEISELTGAASDLRVLASTYDGIGDILQRITDERAFERIDTADSYIESYERAKSYYEKEITVLENLAALTKSVEDLRLLADAREQRSFRTSESVSRGYADKDFAYKSAIEDSLRALEVREEIFKRTGEIPDKKALEGSYFALSTLYDDIGNEELASFYLKKSGMEF